MAISSDQLIQLILKLQEPIPQYVLGCMPAIATIGIAPDKGLKRKILWLLRCLGCPFTGLFYTLNIKGDTIGLGSYWLRSNQFAQVAAAGRLGQQLGQQILYRPVGHHAKEIRMNDQDPVVLQLLEECTAEASVLDRLSSLASVYYIFVGIFSGIARAASGLDPCTAKDWPYLPLTLAWTLPAIYKRVSGGKLIVKDPRVLLDDYNTRNNANLRVFVRDLSNSNKGHQDALVLITFFLFSTIIPGIAVLLAYFTKPVKYGCRSIYLTVICSTWTLNNIIAYISHIRGEQSVTSNRLIHTWFCLSGNIIGVLLIILALLSYTPSWWVHVFKESCVTCESSVGSERF